MIINRLSMKVRLKRQYILVKKQPLYIDLLNYKYPN